MRPREQTAAPAATEASALRAPGGGNLCMQGPRGASGSQGQETPVGLRDQGAWLLSKLEFQNQKASRLLDIRSHTRLLCVLVRALERHQIRQLRTWLQVCTPWLVSVKKKDALWVGDGPAEGEPVLELYLAPAYALQNCKLLGLPRGQSEGGRLLIRLPVWLRATGTNAVRPRGAGCRIVH